MKILTISGSTRRASSNTQLLRTLSGYAPQGIRFTECQKISKLPIFNQDDESERTPQIVLDFCEEVKAASGIIISSPEYVHAIPGGLKNAIDWLVSREEIIRKPIILAHASHRGDEALESLKRVLATVSEYFTEEIFLRIPISSMSADEIDEALAMRDNIALMREFILKFINHIEATRKHALG